MKKFTLLFIVFMMWVVTALFAATAEVSWNANTETDLKGYNLYQSFVPGLPGVATANILAPTTTYLATGLPDGIVYFWLSAYDVSGNESEVAGPVSIEIKVPPAKPTGLKVVLKN